MLVDHICDNYLIKCMKTETNREEEAQKEDLPSVNIYEHVALSPTA